MAFFSGLCSMMLLLWAIGHLLGISSLQVLSTDARIAAAVMFVLIGVAHLVKPRKLVYMMEGMLPFPFSLIIFTGILEILLGVGLLIPAFQYYAG